MCPASSELISSYADGRRRVRIVRRFLQRRRPRRVTLRGIDLNVDWHTGDVVDVTMTPAAECCDDEEGNMERLSHGRMEVVVSSIKV